MFAECSAWLTILKKSHSAIILKLYLCMSDMPQTMDNVQHNCGVILCVIKVEYHQHKHPLLEPNLSWFTFVHLVPSIHFFMFLFVICLVPPVIVCDDISAPPTQKICLESISEIGTHTGQQNVSDIYDSSWRMEIFVDIRWCSLLLVSIKLSSCSWE